MGKDVTTWFKHDTNAKDDTKCVQLIEQLGLEGYGIFWVLLEVLRDQPGYRYPLNLLPALARRYNTSGEKMKTVVCAYNLFSLDEHDFFYSDSLLSRMTEYERVKEKIAENGRKGGLSKAKARLKQGSSKALANPSERKGIEENRLDNNTVVLLPITPAKIEAARMQVKTQFGFMIVDARIIDYWNSFQHSYMKPEYPNDDERFGHFFNWLKKQDVKKGELPTNPHIKPFSEVIKKYEQ